ncbi:MAG: RHS repeat-associated core domain-containing protein [Chlamydiales bacterium]|nr:RHS repeat-associated core domain-containing protein [Chlamydiales bacterium]
MRRLLLAFTLVIALFLPLLIEAAGKLDPWSHGLVNVTTGEVRAPTPLPSSAGQLRRQLANPSFKPTLQVDRKTITIRNIDGTSWEFDGDQPKRIAQTGDTFTAHNYSGNYTTFFDSDNNLYKLLVAGVERRVYEASSKQDLYRLKSEKQANGTQITFEYDKEGRLERVQHQAGVEALTWLSYRYEGRAIHIDGSDGLTVSYQFDDNEHLVAVDGILCSYDEEGKLTRYTQPDGYYVAFTYEAGKVAKLEAPIGHDETPVVLAQYRFELDHTDVIDAEGGLIRFNHDAFGNIVSKKSFGRSSEEPYRIEAFKWSSSGLLEACFLQDQCTHRFSYDSFGNVITETQGSGHEVQYEYDSLHRVVKRFDAETSTEFTYLNDTDLVETKLISDQEGIRLRYHYKYNSSGQLIDATIDDGVDVNPEQLAGMTQRRCFSAIYAGSKPLLFDEKYLDQETNEEKIQKTTLLSYDNHGRVLERHLVDSEGMCYHTTRFSYDQKGQVSSASNESDGIRQYRYDAVGRVVHARDSAKGTSIKSTYDLAGRVIATDLTDEKKRTFHQSYRYDNLGRRIASRDIYGNETRYVYDDHGRLVQTIFPALDGKSPTITRKYDANDRVVKIVDPNGYAMEIQYHVSGNPTDISYPDGTHEHFDYQSNGNLERHVARNGVVTDYKRDFLSRVIEKTLSGRSGEAITASATYDPFDLVSVTDPTGRRTRYEHDAAGRIASMVLEWEGGSSELQYEYDKRSQVIGAKQWYGEQEDAISMQIERDSNGSPIACRLLDSMEKGIMEILPPARDEKALHVDEDFSHINAQGQRVLQVKATDEQGITTVTTYNVLGHVAEQQVIDSFGRVVSIASYRYDAAGHVVEANLNGDLTQYRHGPLGRLEQAIEHAGTPQAAHSYYEYNSLGQLSQTTRPDGQALSIAYDDFGRMERVYSSDNSIDYSYRYDQQHRPIEVTDHLTGVISAKEYHPLGMITRDVLGDNLDILKSYDHQGRLATLMLPDASSISYTYDAARLIAVERHDTNGNVLYSHRYTRFGDDGRPTQMIQPLNAGTATLAWDDAGRCSEVTSKWWSQRIDSRDNRGNMLSSRIWDLHGRYTVAYKYDGFNRLSEESGVINRTYSYDAASNRIEGLKLHDVDSNGNVVKRVVDGEQQHLRYDAMNRLVEISVSGRPRVSYTYDAFNRRLSKTSWQGDHPTKVRYLYDGDKEIGSVDEKGNLVELRVLGQGLSGDVGAAVAIELQGEVYAPIHDCRGNIVCLVDSDGSAAECYRYGAFGEEVLYDSFGEVIEEALSPWRFSSKRVDSEVGIIHFGCRDYDPAAGRWLTPDPLGTADGPNRYIYVHNNPLSLIDPQGLFSMYAAWQGAKSTAMYCYRQFNAFSQSLSAFKTNLFDDIMDDFRFVANEMIGPTLFLLAGLHGEPVEFGVVGSGEFNDSVRISHVNGVLNDREAALEAAQLISKTHGGVNVHYTYRPTAGWTGDIFAIVPTLLGWTSPTAVALADGWRELISEVGGIGHGGLIIHYAHSLGGAETACAKRLMEPDELKMIRVTTFGSAKVLANEGFLSVSNYVSSLDIVAMGADAFAYFNAMMQGTGVIFLSHKGILFVDDHKFCGPIYGAVLEELGRRFVSLYDPSERDSTLRMVRDGA